MSRPYQLCGLGNAIVDIFLELGEAEFVGLGYERGTMVLVEPEVQRAFVRALSEAGTKTGEWWLGGKLRHRVLPAGRPRGLRRLRRRRSIWPVLRQRIRGTGIDIGNPIIVNEATGTSVCIVTPDAERTMRTCLAVASHLSAKHVDEKRIKNSGLAVHRRLCVRQSRHGPDSHSGSRSPRPAAQNQNRDHLLRRVHPSSIRRSH